jgi:enoyl-[acyl-carrier protein] reductase I
MLPIDLSGKRAFVAGVADDGGFGFAISKALVEAGATVCVGTWPPAMGIFEKLLERGKMDESLVLSDGRKMGFEKIYPLDAAYDTLEDAPPDVRDNKRYRERGDFSIAGLVQHLKSDFGEGCLDIVVHSLANGPEVKKPLVDTTRAGYLAAISVSAYSNVAMVRALSPLLRPGGNFLSLTYLAGEKVIPGYGGGMSTAKAALDADVRTLAYEAGRRWGVRVNAISAGPWASRAASAIGFIDMMIKYCQENSPLPRPIEASDVGATAAFLCSPLAKAITGTVVYVDNGYHAMGMATSDGALGQSSSASAPAPSVSTPAAPGPGPSAG